MVERGTGPTSGPEVQQIARWSRRQRRSHVEFIFRSGFNVLRQFGENFPDIARESDRDGNAAAEGTAIPIEFGQGENFLADRHSRRIAVMFDDFQGTRNALPRIASQVGNVAIAVNEIIPATELNHCSA